MTAPARFRQADLTRALRGAEAAGVRPVRVEIDGNGRIVMTFDQAQAPKGAANSWDDLRRTGA